MSKKDIFVVLPYLKTAEPVHLRGILFRSNTDLEGLSPEQQTHLKTLFAMFFLRNDLRITRMMYAHFEQGDDREANDNLIQRLYEAQTLINYLYSTPHPTMGDPFFHLENASMYVFTVDRFFAGMIWPSDPNYGVENLAKDEPLADKYVDGYYGVLNGVLHFWVVAGNRIYPSVPHLSLNSQNLAHDLMFFAQEAKNWALVDLLSGYGYEDAELNERIFTALEWHNRSTAEEVDEKVALLDLSIAFESLLNFENSDKVTDRFRETVMTLLGYDTRLGSWLDQFYNARSAIAHKGKTHRFMFYAMDWDRNRIAGLHKVKETSQESALPYRSLTMYGRRIFRLCLKAILSGARMAEEDGLSAMFVHNQERLEKICKQLEKTTEPPEKRLHSIVKDVGDLQEHWWSSEKLVLSKTLVAAGRLVLQTYLETKPQLSQEGETRVQEVLQQLRQKGISEDEKLHLFEGLVTALAQGQDSSVTNPSPFETEHPFTIVSSILNYLTSPGFLTRKWFQSQNNKPALP